MATKTKPHLITPEGLERLKKELEYLRTEGRQRIAERLESAFADGQDDEFVDNAELEAARNEQSFLEGRILELEEILGNYQVIEENGPHDTVSVGNRITVVEEDSEEEERYHLVGAAEADPAEGRISNESPLGKALLGAKVGDTVEVNAPNGLISFRITKIE